MENEDKYELICNPTNEIKDMNKTVLVSEKKKLLILKMGMIIHLKIF